MCTAYLPNDGDPNWNTRKQEIDLVVRAMGSITMDPCSNASSVVPADVCYTIEDDGLAQRWFGNVFVNPPFPAGDITAFLAKGLAEYYRGHADQLVYFLPANKTEQPWFHALALQADAICFCRKRRSFDRPTTDKGSAPFAVLFLYFGPHVDRFEYVFGREGFIVRPSAVQNLSAQTLMLMMLRMTQLEVPETAILADTARATWGALYQSIKHLTIEQALEILTTERILQASKSPRALPAKTPKKTAKRKKRKAPPRVKPKQNRGTGGRAKPGVPRNAVAKRGYIALIKIGKVASMAAILKRAGLSEDKGVISHPKDEDTVSVDSFLRSMRNTGRREWGLSWNFGSSPIARDPKILEKMHADVNKAVTRHCASNEDGVPMRELKKALKQYNEQQIRRSLRKLEEQGVIQSSGVTIGTVYHPAR